MKLYALSLEIQTIERDSCQSKVPWLIYQKSKKGGKDEKERATYQRDRKTS